MATWTIRYNGIPVPGEYTSREQAAEAVENTLGKVNFNMFDIAFWPGIGARGNIMIELFEEK
jgi:hypothetical protein